MTSRQIPRLADVADGAPGAITGDGGTERGLFQAVGPLDDLFVSNGKMTIGAAFCGWAIALN